jgi:putative redox protein
VVTDKKTPDTESASVYLVEGMHFVGEIDGFRIDMDAKEEAGGVGARPDPVRFLLLGLAGCTAMDVISILRKKRQEVTALAVEVHGRRVDEHPRVYDYIEVMYRVRGKGVDPKAVERAIKLSETCYCPVIAMVAKAADISSHFKIEEEA